MEFKLFTDTRYKYPNTGICHHMTNTLEERKADQASWKLRNDR